MTIGNDPQPAKESEQKPSPTSYSQPEPEIVGTSFLSSLTSPLVKITGIACLGILLVAGVIAYTISRGNGQPDAALVNPHSSLAASHYIAKPSPIGHTPVPSPIQPTPAQPPAPPVSAQPVLSQPTPALPPTAPNHAAVVAPTPAAPPVQAQHYASALPFGVRMAASRDGFSNGCRNGQLVIDAYTVTFTCPHDASKSVAVRVDQVRNLDDNGIVLFPGQKYHFDIAGKEKQAVRALFALWLANARHPAADQTGN